MIRKSGRLEKGFTIPLALLAAVVVTGLIIGIAQVVKSNSKTQVVYDNMSTAHRRAESAMLEALGLLSVDGTAYLTNPFFDVERSTDGGATKYRVHVERRNFGDVSNGYYIISWATTTVSGKHYSCGLHTYARVSNVGDYFAAINSTASISAGVDLSQAKVYGKNLVFDVSGAATNVLRAEFVNLCTPPIDWDSTTKSHVIIFDAAHTGYPYDQPILLSSELLFPQLLDADMTRYKQLSHLQDLNGNPTVGHVACDFRTATWGGDIYPPGYNVVNPTTDHYYTSPPGGSLGHTTSNADHVYYCPDPGIMYIQGRIHGQVLFVADNDIHIVGDLTSGDGTAGDLVVLPATPNTAFPGTYDPNNPGVSTAHQAVLLTRGNIVIDNYVSTGVVTGSGQTIQALAFSPQGNILPAGYLNAADQTNLGLQFTGSMILNDQPMFSSVYQGATGRHYYYMNSLKTNPPPDLPALSEIYYSLEETTGVSN